jgi:glycosyltransferase involved in cell wall biosynthesis
METPASQIDSLPEPKVSVCFITYNHEPYVRSALESVLAQRTAFPYEIVVGDDCSTDATVDIIEKYRSQRPETIRILPTDRNVGVTANFARTITACRGQYVAILEGDDLWTDPEKLAIQVDYLDRHPESVMCFHPVTTIDEGGENVSMSYRPPRFRRVFRLQDLLVLGNFVPTCSVLFRNKVLPAFPTWFTDLWIADFPLLVLHAQYGNLRLIRRPMGSYRVHAGGIFSASARHRRWEEIRKTYDFVDGELGPRYHGVITSLRTWLQCFESLRAGRLSEARRLAARRMVRRPVNGQSVRAAIVATSPRLYRTVARSMASGRL